MPRADGLAEEFDDDLVPAVVPEAPSRTIEAVIAPPAEVELAELRAMNAALVARVAVLEAPSPENFLPLKVSAADCGMNYETLRSWAIDGHVTARREGGRLFVDVHTVKARQRRLGLRK
jgi:hypothetical protein